jgi:hypothetical protein
MPHPQYKGTNLPVYSVGPDWKASVLLRAIYSTIVREALDLSELRSARFPRSLFGLRFSTLPLSAQETAYIRRVMELAQALPVIMPVWTDASKLTAGILSGATTLPVDDSSPTLLSVLYDYVIVWQDFKTWEVLATDSISKTSITLADATTRAYPAGTLVFPILIGKMARPNARALTDVNGVHQVEFEERFHGLTDQSVIEQSLPEFDEFLSYTDACRAEFVVTVPDLDPDTTYSLEISADGETFAPHIFFRLLTPTEIATGTKILTVNNDYFGLPYWRIALGGVPLSGVGRIQASVVDPPVISLTNLSEITTNTQGAAIAGALAGAMDGLRTLEFYSDGGFILPYSFIEDPLVFTSFDYRRFQKKYALRQWAWDHWGTLLAEISGVNSEVVSTTGPAGATIKWTRDGSDPTETTAAPIAYGGIANNAYAIQDAFGGIIKARAFKDGCRSPLAMVAVDKVMYERPMFTTNGLGNAVAGSCDLPTTDVVTGLPIESGQSCNILYGGICPFEDATRAFLAGVLAPTIGRPSSDGLHGATLRSRTDNPGSSTYIGWPIHAFSASSYDFQSSIWSYTGDPVYDGYFNGWQIAARNHNWAILGQNNVPNFLGVILADFTESLAGPIGSAGQTYRATWAGERDLAINDILAATPIPDPVCNTARSYYMFADRFDIVRSPLYYNEPREAFWADPLPVTDVPFDPPPATGPTNFYDDFESYYDGDATVGSLSFRTGTDWDAAWTFKDGNAQTYGWDFFEQYANGAIPEHTTHLSGDGYIYYSGGEAWEQGVTNEWYFSSGIFGIVYKDDFESYANGPAPFQMTGGSGWYAEADSTGWRMDNDLIGGFEDFESYANGTWVGSNTGTNFVANENWRST